MLEYHLIKACLDVKVWQEWHPQVSSSSFSPPAREVWTVLGHWGVEGHHTNADTKLLQAHRAAAFSHWGIDRVELFNIGLEQVESLKVELSQDMVWKLWLERETAATVALKADTFIASPEEFKGGFTPVLEKELDKLHRASPSESDDTLEADMSMDIEDILDKLRANGDVNWRLQCLQMSVGPLYPGLFVVIGGRPESGKTTLLASEVSRMLLQLPEDGIVAFFNNEQSNPAVKLRLSQAMLGATSSKIKQYPKQANKRFAEMIGTRRLMVMDVHNRGIVDVEKRLVKLGDKVGLIVFDQANKLAGMEKQSGNEAERLQKLSARLKGLASTCAPVMTTVWANASAEGERWIDQNQLHGSKTGIPGEAETIINIGYSKEEADKGLRFLNIPKNKSQTCQDERVRHSHWTVLLKHEIARVEDPKD